MKLGEVDLVLFCVKRLKNSFLKFQNLVRSPLLLQ